MRHLFLSLVIAAAGSAQDLRIVSVATGLSNVTDIQNAGDGSRRLFIAEQGGRIRVILDGTVRSQPFLDISNRISTGGERGLLGFAFAPSYAQSGRFYVDYTDTSGDTVVSLFRSTPGSDIADSGSETVLLRIPQPFANHNGGQLRFGPDGFLYIAMGDGGSAGDPQNNAQNLGSQLGKILRLDVESQPGQALAPGSNPFRNTPGARPEIWAYGLRNPWRFSFDRATGDMWIADVGQNAWEEVNYQPASSPGGENYGWRQMEGTHCYVTNCSMSGFTMPAIDYGQTGGNCSVTGGFVYRGPSFASIRGLYIYGDYCSGRIWGLSRESGEWRNQLLLSSGQTISTFGEDEAGELYVGSHSGGGVYRLEASGAPRFSAASVVNAASSTPDLSAGSLATVYVTGARDQAGITSAQSTPLPKSMEDVSISVGGVDAPILAVANTRGVEQVNFQIPFELAARDTAEIVVTKRGVASAPQTITLKATSPAIYTSDGSRAIAVHNSNYALVTENAPLVPGEIAFIYASGLGAVTNTPATGAGASATALSEVRTPVLLELDGIACDVPFAGLAPGLVGVYQVNFRVPNGVQSGLRDLRLGSSVVKLPVR